MRAQEFADGRVRENLVNQKRQVAEQLVLRSGGGGGHYLYDVVSWGALHRPQKAHVV
jgi:dihydroxyacetone kinase